MAAPNADNEVFLTIALPGGLSAAEETRAWRLQCLREADGVESVVVVEEDAATRKKRHNAPRRMAKLEDLIAEADAAIAAVDDDMVAGRLKLSNVKPRRVQNGSPAADTIKKLLREHHESTASKHAKSLLESFDASHFCQVVPPSEEDKPHHAVAPEGSAEFAVSR